MKQIIYALQFKGQAAPVAGSATVIKASTSALSCTATTTMGPQGVSGGMTPGSGGKATFESEVTLTGESSFVESGSIAFGEGNHRLRFSTVGQGHLGSSADPKLKSGVVMWRIEKVRANSRMRPA